MTVCWKVYPSFTYCLCSFIRYHLAVFVWACFWTRFCSFGVWRLLFTWPPWWLHGKESACQCRRHKRHKFYPCIGRIPWRRKWHPPLGFLPWKFHGQRSLMGYRPWGCEESNVTEDAHLPFNWYITGLIAIALSCRIYKSSRLICIKLVSQE